MSDGVAAFVRWQAGCYFTGGYGIADSDNFYCGFRNYEQPYPCPNGLPIVATPLSECEGYQRRIAKAKRDIDVHSNHIDWQERVAAAQVEFPAESIAGLKTFIEESY